MAHMTQVGIGVSKDADFTIVGDENDSISVLSRICAQTKSTNGTFSRIDLGECTKKQINFLKECLDRLRVHAT